VDNLELVAEEGQKGVIERLDRKVEQELLEMIGKQGITF
jgi:hypothetical protein